MLDSKILKILLWHSVCEKEEKSEGGLDTRQKSLEDRGEEEIEFQNHIVQPSKKIKLSDTDDIN